MYRKVLVTLDGSELSEAVLPEVERLAATGTEVTLLRVAKPPKIPAAAAVAGPAPERLGGPLEGQPMETLDQALERVRDEGELYLNEKAARLQAKGVTVESTSVQFADDPADTIEQFAESRDMELIMMATHGRRGLARLIFGSVTSRILQSGVKPVLLVRPVDL